MFFCYCPPRASLQCPRAEEALAGGGLLPDRQAARLLSLCRGQAQGPRNPVSFSTESKGCHIVPFQSSANVAVKHTP